eukprot:CAMPEP_0172489114 /NCGR_PEP_ID=MMETSP1066-20121228/18922_1 /TAXON_ID=671091 /ORGANISM="Coscinodiscus wailesii, Strain CCMP2513" /LENGTH=98 /DNA_ID=CAMNT_0013256751 /DNA_START=136 /DNA_END=432 /DNA_ORIENTATION=+
MTLGPPEGTCDMLGFNECPNDGKELGSFVNCVGDLVGNDVERKLGPSEGPYEGNVLGISVFGKLGTSDGTNEGNMLMATIGLKLGLSEGNDEYSVLGD